MSMDHSNAAAQPTQGHAEAAAGSQNMSSQTSAGMYGAAQPATPGTQQPNAGPDMGQPHYSAQIPGSAPFQGAPGAYVQNQPQAGFYSMGENQMGQQPQMQPQQEQPTGQPVFQAPPQMPYQQAPIYGQAMYGQPYTMPQYPPQYGPQATQPQYGPQYAQAPTQPPIQNQTDPRGENRYGELYGLIQEAAEGNPDVSRFLNFFQSTSSDFWKGALVGAGLTLLLTNDTVKGAIAGGVSGLMGMFDGNAEAMEAEEDRKAEEAFAAKEK